MQPNVPLGAKHHPIALRVENNQIRKRPTSWSLSKLLFFGLYLKLSAWASTFLLDLPGTAGPITGKTREKVELLSLSFFFYPFFLSFNPFCLPPELFGLKSSLKSTFCHMSIPHWLLGLPLSLYPSTLDFSPITCFHMYLIGPT